MLPNKFRVKQFSVQEKKRKLDVQMAVMVVILDNRSENVRFIRSMSPSFPHTIRCFPPSFKSVCLSDQERSKE